MTRIVHLVFGALIGVAVAAFLLATGNMRGGIVLAGLAAANLIVAIGVRARETVRSARHFVPHSESLVLLIALAVAGVIGVMLGVAASTQAIILHPRIEALAYLLGITAVLLALFLWLSSSRIP